MNKMNRLLVFATMSFALLLSTIFSAGLFAGDEFEERPQWKLVFSDDFERAELGGDWEPLGGVWKIQDGCLRGAGTLVSSRAIAKGDKPQCQRLEFDATTDVKPFIFEILKKEPTPEVTVCDISPFIHCENPKDVPAGRKKRPLNVWQTGYFFQFGGFYNTRNKLLKAGASLVDQEDAAITIVPNKRHHIIVENDEGFLRMFVDGELVFQYFDKNPIREASHGHIGFYFYGANKVDNLKVYVKEAGEEVPARAPAASSDAKGKLALVAGGKSLAPIVVPKDAPHFTRQAADTLAEYIEKVSGARPEVIAGTPDPMPEQAIWVGYQPCQKNLFPNVDLEFKYPEEILISANAKHVLVAGRDRWDPDFTTAPKESFQSGRLDVEGYQQEYGTANAVYTFIQDCLGVRWLWPGELGEDIVKQPAIALPAFIYRYHPQIRQRNSVFGYQQRYRTKDGDPRTNWMKYQRLWLDSLYAAVGGHAFGEWWERFHESNPDFFALQPDGTRIGMNPDGQNVKMCLSNPKVAEQWVEDAGKKLAVNPYVTYFSAAENDGGNWGYCVCDKCQSWDNPAARRMRTIWSGVIQDYLSMSDRQVRFANLCAGLLDKKYPGKNYCVTIHAYGNSVPAPVEIKAADNVVPSLVHNFFQRYWAGTQRSDVNRAEYLKWTDKTKRHFWRPNVGDPARFQNGGPGDVSGAGETLRLVGQRGCIGILVDYIREYWLTQGPLYYLVAQMTWNPFQDAEALMDDYCKRAYGPAADTMAVYWTLMEVARSKVARDPENDWLKVFNATLYEQADGLLKQAEKTLAGSPEIYAQRLAYVRAGLSFLQITSDNLALIDNYKFSQGKDKRSYQKALENCKILDALIEKYPEGFPPTVKSKKSQGLAIYPEEIRR